MDYLCAKYGDCSFSRFDFILQADRQTDRQTESHTDTAKRVTHTTEVNTSRPRPRNLWSAVYRLSSSAA